MKQLVGVAVVALGAVLLAACTTTSYAHATPGVDLSKPHFKFCLFSLGPSDAERAYVARLIAKSDGSDASRRALVVALGNICTGNQYEVMMACLSFGKLKDCSRSFFEPKPR